jgi:hypothetical protein
VCSKKELVKAKVQRYRDYTSYSAEIAFSKAELGEIYYCVYLDRESAVNSNKIRFITCSKE